MSSTPLTATSAALEARLAGCMASALTARAQMLPHDVTERLRVGRSQALDRARQVRLQISSAQTTVAMAAGGAAALGGFGAWWQRAASLTPLIVLVLGILMIENHTLREQVVAAAEIDALLLSDDLPPAAYSDPGFGEFLRNPPPP